MARKTVPHYLEKKNCHDCKAKPGKLHEWGCDTERCPWCGGQLLSCGPFYGCRSSKEAPSDKERLPWTGIWPGVEECVEFGWYSKFIGKPGLGGTWQKTTKDDPEGGPDLNRLATDAKWDPKRKRFVLP